MKVVNICGGLGNQMFQYAFAMSLQERFPEEDIYVDTSHYHTIFFKHYKGINLHNGYEIDKLFPNATIPIAKWSQLAQLSYYIPNYLLSRIGRRCLPVRLTEFVAPRECSHRFLSEVYTPGDRYYEGYWQSAKYFETIKQNLREVFRHPTPNEYNRELIAKIEACQSVGIHVRRGDYVNAPAFRGICDIEYYRKSIEWVLSNGMQHTFFIFSNDLDWCRTHLVEMVDGHEVVFVTENKGEDSCWDMFLMTYCKDLIIANSSFSWWGAFLNENARHVLAPNPWTNREVTEDVYDSSWIRIKAHIA